MCEILFNKVEEGYLFRKILLLCDWYFEVVVFCDDDFYLVSFKKNF